MTRLVLSLTLVLCACVSAPPLARSVALAEREEGQCDACGALTDAHDRGRRWPDGRLACGACADTAVVTQADAQDVLADARDAVADLLALDLADVPVSLALTGRHRLSVRAGEELAHPDLRAFTEVLEVLRGERVETRRFSIHALVGLPRDCLFGILAHELFHVWQIQTGGIRDRTDPAFREGGAQYVQHRVLAAHRLDSWAKDLLENPDPVYGEGLRRFRKLARALGEAKALELSATSDHFPPRF